MENKNKNKTHELEQQVNHLRELLNDEREQNRATKNKVNGGYYMTSRKAEKSLRILQQESPVGSLVFSVLREHMKIGTNAVTISSPTLAKILNKSLRTIARAIKHLLDNCYVQIIKTGNTNTYVINEQISFAGTAGQRKAVFSATIVAHEDEQEEGWEKVKTLKTTTSPIDRRASDNRAQARNMNRKHSADDTKHDTLWHATTP